MKRTLLFVLLLFLVIFNFPITTALFDEQECVLSLDMEQLYFVPDQYRASYVFDSSPFRNHGEPLPANTTGYFGPSKAFGYHGYALDFDGEDDKIVFGDVDSDSLNISSAFTIMMWVNYETAHFFRLLSMARTSAVVAYEFGSNPSNTSEYRFLINSTTVLATAITHDLDEWVHLAFVFDSTETSDQLDVYQNGDLSVSADITGVIDYLGASDWVLGTNRKDKTDGYYDGLYDELRIYPFALTEDDIEYDMATQIDENKNQPFTYYYDNVNDWETSATSDVHGHYENDPLSPWVMRNASYTSATVNRWNFIFGFQQYRMRATFFSNHTVDNAPLRPIANGFEWRYYFFKDGVWETCYKTVLLRRGGANDHIWYIGFYYHTRGESEHLVKLAAVNVTDNVPTTEWDWCVDGFTSQDGTQFVTRVTSENATYAWSLLEGEGWETDRYNVEHRFDLVDETESKRYIEWFDPAVAVEWVCGAADNSGVVSVPRHRAGIIQKILGFTQTLRRIGDVVVWQIIKVLVPTVELPSLPYPEVVVPALEQWKRALLDLPHKLYEGFTSLNDALSNLNLAQAITTAFTEGMLSQFQPFINFLNAIGSQFGVSGVFGQLRTTVTSFYVWFSTSVSYATSMLTQAFSFWSEVMGRFISTLTTLLSGWVTIAQQFFSLMEGGWGSGVNLYTSFIAPFLPLIPVALLLYLWLRFETGGVDAVSRDLMFMVNIFHFFIDIFLSVARFFITSITAIIEAIPVVE